nr:PREDICTED: MICAL C-terminal-like protein isoform X2 [Latimeria chalumnae]|eukprot:XP_014346919.1 PREDICTED: MICAL C-terminal-like protein isoform X2 [Latimeria chalumnae]
MKQEEWNVNALQRANSFHSSPSHKHQMWKRTIKTTLPLLISKKKDRNLFLEEASHFYHGSTQSFQDNFSESQFTDGTKTNPLIENEHYSSSKVESDAHDYNDVKLESHNIESEQIDMTRGFDIKSENECSMRSFTEPESYTTEHALFANLSSKSTEVVNEVNAEKKEKGNQGSYDGQLQGKMKRLTLSPLQKGRLLDWNYVAPDVAYLETENSMSNNGTLENIFSGDHKNKQQEKESQIWNSPPLSQSSCNTMQFPTLNQHDLLESSKTGGCTAGISDDTPASPLQSLISTLKKSFREISGPLSPDNINKQQDSKRKDGPLFAGSFFNFTNALNRILGYSTHSSKEEDAVQPQASCMFPHNGQTSNTIELKRSVNKPVLSSAGDTDNASLAANTITDNVTSSSVWSKCTSENPGLNLNEKPPNNKIEDMPRLSENVSLKGEPSTRTYNDDSYFQRRKTFSLFSSLRFKGTNSENSEKPNSALEEPTHKTDIWKHIINFRKKHNDKEPKESQTNTATAVSNSSSRTALPGSELLPVKTQIKENDFKSSSDELEDVPTLKLKIIQYQLQELEENQQKLKERGVKLEKALRGELGYAMEDDRQLLQDWFKLVLEKNKLASYESQLMVFAQELEVEDHQNTLQEMMRERMATEDSFKTKLELAKEQEILSKMLETKEHRDTLVTLLEEQRLKEKAEDKDFESFVLSKCYQFNWT